MMFNRGRCLQLVSAILLGFGLLASHAGTLSGYFRQPGVTNINLTTEGALGWTHWGLASPSDFNQKNIGGQPISNFTLIGPGPAAQVGTNQISFSWTDGTPTISAASITGGVFVTNLTNGFHVTLPADTTLRRLKVYVGAFAGQGELHASLSDFSALDYDDVSMSSAFDLENGVYTINYQADSASQTLSVDYTAYSIFNTNGLVSLNAATVTTNKPPTVSITSPTNNTPLFVTQDVPVTATASDLDGSVTKVEFYEILDGNTNFIDQVVGSPYSVTWPNIQAGTNYLSAVAYDNDGGVTVSAPVMLVVKTNPPPVIVITSPVTDANFLAAANIPITVSTNGTTGAIQKVEYFQGTNKIGENAVSPFSFNWNGVATGLYSLTAKATGSGGATAVSAPVTVFVTTNGGFMFTNVSLISTGADINLTSEGTNDWVDWGRYTDQSVVRKAGVSNQISNFGLTNGSSGDVFQFGDNLNGYSWTDGTPISAVTNTTTGVYVVGLKKGFTLTAPADPTRRTLKVYVGAFGARGKFLAYLSDLSAPIYANLSVDNPGSGQSSVFTISYSSASPGQNLVVRYTVDVMYDNSFGNVTLQAATLSSTNAPPTASLVGPTNYAGFLGPATIQLQATASDTGGSISKVEFFQNGAKIGETNASPYNFAWTNVAVGVYSLTAKATDNSGLTFTTPATIVSVTNAGGFISGIFTSSPPSVDLTAEGRNDWENWGCASPGSGNPSQRYFNRKRNVTAQLSNYTVVGSGSASRYDANLTAYSWTDGIPTLSVGSTATGFFITGASNGFQITAPADTNLRRLKIYIGVFRSRGKLDVRLSDSSAKPYIDTSVDKFGNAVGCYTLDYAAASAGKTLTVKYTSDISYDPGFGNVTLQAATLPGGLPAVLQLQKPAPANAFAFSFPTDNGYNYQVLFANSLTQTNWQIYSNFIGNGLNAAITNSLSSSTQRFFRVVSTP